MNALNTAIYSRLSGATALTTLIGGTAAPRIYCLQAPEGATLPYVVYSTQGGGDENLTATRSKNLIEYVRVYASSNAQAGSIDAQLDTALHMNPFASVTGWSDFWMAREEDIELVENDPTGSQVFVNGGMYRILLG